MAEPIAFRLNGVDRRTEVPPDTRLIDFLRDRLGLTAAKKACGIGRCGACAVLIDGRAVNACLVMAWQMDGADIVTPEGLETLPHAKTVRQALAEANAFQCGYCASGFVVVLTAYLRGHPGAQEQDIRAALEGNICRCTGYRSILRGAMAAVRMLAEPDRDVPSDGSQSDASQTVEASQ
jgi:carbon-monoxide dehydrogenase small subunit